MLFKLSLKNMKKSSKDYAIYFMTLILGVAVFYVFNSLESQQAMKLVSDSGKEMIHLMMQILSGVSVFVSIVLGFLIVYANNFMIKRRKKEFGIYMTLGMGKGKISRILLGETIIIGLVSLFIGLLLGVFASQLMSILVAKLFEVDMTQFEFSFSQMAFFKTILYFGILYLAVMVFNMITVSRYKLIDLLNAGHKNEKIKFKNPGISILLFVVSLLILAYCYYMVTMGYQQLTDRKIYITMGLGVLGTFLFFWSLSGCLLRAVQSSKKIYLRGLNSFTLRQINSKINTTVVSMSIICLMLFLTIGILSVGLSLNQNLREGLQKLVPVDININTHGDGEDLSKTIEESLLELGYPMQELDKDYLQVNVYATSELTIADELGEEAEGKKEKIALISYDMPGEMMKVSDYNKVAGLYGNPEYQLKEDEYVMLCDYQGIQSLRNAALSVNTKLTIGGKEYRPQHAKCEEGILEMSPNPTNIGILVLPDAAIDESWIVTRHMVANYAAKTEEGKQEAEKHLRQSIEKDTTHALRINTKIDIYGASIGLSAMVIFIAIYLGIIFLISSAAILALKELSESADNRERYCILRKIGTDEKVIHHALFIQIGIFFLMPLLLASIHAIFGIQFACHMLESFGGINLVNPIALTALALVMIYGGYFLATYLGSKRIIKE